MLIWMVGVEIVADVGYGRTERIKVSVIRLQILKIISNFLNDFFLSACWEHCLFPYTTSRAPFGCTIQMINGVKSPFSGIFKYVAFGNSWAILLFVWILGEGYGFNGVRPLRRTSLKPIILLGTSSQSGPIPNDIHQNKQKEEEANKNHDLRKPSIHFALPSNSP